LAVIAWEADRQPDREPFLQQFDYKPPLTVHDAHSGELRGTFFTAAEGVSTWAHSSDFRYLAAVATDGTVWIADARTGQEWRAETDGSAATALRFSADGEYLAVTDRSPATLLRTRTSEVLQRWPVRFNYRNAPRFCPNDDFLVLEDLYRDENVCNLLIWSSDLHIWNCRTATAASVLKRATCLAIASDGKTLFAAQKPEHDPNFSRVVLWDLASAQPRGEIGTFSAGRLGLALTADGRLAALWTEWPDARINGVAHSEAEGMGNLEFWDLTAGSCIARAKTPATADAGRFSPDGQHFMLACTRGVIVFDPNTGQERWDDRRDSARDSWPLLITADSSTLVQGRNSSIEFRSLATGALRLAMPAAGRLNVSPLQPGTHHRFAVSDTLKRGYVVPTGGPLERSVRELLPANWVPARNRRSSSG
jgi:WD40 repeat protein